MFARVFGLSPLEVSQQDISMVSLWREFISIDVQRSKIEQKRQEQKLKMNNKN